MPLSRYEIRSEYSLANPDLYRVADKDDPEGLLEGVAMAGLVGIIRQLGDLAEFAAEVFHDLHEDVLALAARGHELLVRVQQLEAEVPLIEKMALVKVDHGKCFYNPGLEWHVHIYNDQNHFTQGDLPRFIRSAYEDSRSPPRLFPLDRFDVAGAGSCLKRFTDPSFFKTEWASSELMKAEKEQRDQKARRLKRKGRRQVHREVMEAKFASHVELRVPAEVENIETLRTTSSASDLSLGSNQLAGDSLMQEYDDKLLSSGSLVSEQEGPQSKILAAEDFKVKESSLDLKREHSTVDTAKHIDVGVEKDLENHVGNEELVVYDSASETDNYMDAVTTMDSEAETDSEMKAKPEVDGEPLVELEGVEASAPPSQPTSEPCRRADGEHGVNIEDKECSIEEEDKEGLAIEGEIAIGNHTPEESLNTEHAHSVSISAKVFVEEENCSFVDGSVAATAIQDDETSTSNSGLGVDTVTKPEVPLIDSTRTVLAEEEDISFVVQSAVILAVKDNVSISISQSNASSSGLEDDAAEKYLQSESNASSPDFEEGAVLNSERHVQSASTSLVLESPEVLVLDEDLCQHNQLQESNVPGKELPQSNSPKDFNQLPESDVLGKDLPQNNSLKDSSQLSESDGLGKDLPQSNSPKELGAVTTRKRWQIGKLFTKEFLVSDLERDSLQVSESEHSESPRKLSLQSSPSSSIQPMTWAINVSKTYHTDDETEDIQVSSASPSSSSSTLSSPRPSTLATTLLNISVEQKPQKSVGSSPHSPMSSYSESGIKMAPYQTASQVETTAEPVMSTDNGCSANSSPQSSSSAAQPFFDPLPSLAPNVNTSSTESLTRNFAAPGPAANNLEIFPPPPPLPPLAWRMTRRMNNTSSKPMESPTSIPISCDVQVSPNNLLQAFMSSTTLPTVPYALDVETVEPTHAFSSPTAGKPPFEKSEAMLDESSMYETGPTDLGTLGGRSADIPQISKPATSHDRGSSSFTYELGMVEQDTISVLATSHFKGENVVTQGPDSSLQKNIIDDSSCVTSSSAFQTGSIPARFEESRLELQTKAAVEYGSSSLQRSDLPHAPAANLEIKDCVEATSSHDMSRLKKRSKWAWTSSTASSDDREVLLDQIRTRSFSLRNTNREKLAAPRPVANINVAAILEKANAIRQAFAGSDEDDDEDWSDG